MKFWTILLCFKSFFQHTYVSLRVVFGLIVDTCRGVSKVKLISSKGNSSDKFIKNWLLSISLYKLGYSVAVLPYSVLKGVLTGLIQLSKDFTHYYYNFYKQGKSIKVLYPEYKDVTLSKAISIVVSSRAKDKFTPFKLVKVIFKFVTKWLFSLTLGASVLLMLFVLRDIPVNKFLFTVVSLGFFTYLLISGFVFFLKKYKYGKYTTAMHRYWRRTFAIFWLLEGYLFLVFLYLAVFSSQEPFFGYDNIQFFKDFTYPWRLFLQETATLIAIILVLRYCLGRLKDMSSTKIYMVITLVTGMLLTMTWSEFYQFYYVLNHYNSLDWTYDEDSFTWSIELETKKTRILLHFITLCIIAKFWHFAFILAFWIFSVSRWLQLDTVHYSLFSANIQNFIILYVLNWIVMYPWIKYAFRRHLYKNYTWMYSNFRNTGSRIFFSDLVTYGHTFLTSVNPFSYPLILTILYEYFCCCWSLGGANFSIYGCQDFIDMYCYQTNGGERPFKRNQE